MSFKRNIYLKMKTLQEARDILFQTFADLPPLSTERISVPDAVGRVLAEPVYAQLSFLHRIFTWPLWTAWP